MGTQILSTNIFGLQTKTRNLWSVTTELIARVEVIARHSLAVVLLPGVEADDAITRTV